jgi:hypothetical protein
VGNPRKGLKRYGQRGYLIHGPRGTYIIERERSYKWFVKRIEMAERYGEFFCETFRRLGPARTYAEKAAGVVTYPYLDVPVCCRRWMPKEIQ